MEQETRAWLQSSRRADTLAVLTLLILCLLFFRKMVFTDLILPRGDAFLYFYPYWDYRNSVLAEFKLPLWNPYLFMGAPFLANIQTGVLYPLNWPVIPFSAPTAVKISTVLHIGLATTGTYVFSRHALQRSFQGSLIAAVVFGLGGYLTVQVEHINQLQGLAWLPWIFYAWSQANLGKRRFVIWLAISLTMILLAGHTQSAFIIGIGLGAWAIWHSIVDWIENKNQKPSWSDIVLPLGILALASVIALALAAIQLLPTLELTQFSNRSGGLPVREALSFSLKPQYVGRGLLPAYRPDALFSEYVAYPGILALVFALQGAWQHRRSRQVIGLLLITGVGLFFAAGTYNPVYWGLVRFVPGFDLFRVPARWLILWAFGVSQLAAYGLDWLFKSDKSQKIAPQLWPGAIVVFLIIAALFAPESADVITSKPELIELIIWFATLVLGLGLVYAVKSGKMPAGMAGTTFIFLITVELLIAGSFLPYNDLSIPQSWVGHRPSVNTLLAAGADQTPPGRYLSMSDTRFDPGELQELEATYSQYLTDDAFFDFIVALKQKEIVAPNLSMHWRIPAMDGFGGGILPMRDFTRYSALMTGDEDVAPDGRLREYLTTIPDLYWLQQTHVQWIITDKVYDAWIDSIYYDLQLISEANNKSPTIEAYPWDPFKATSVGLVGHVENAANLADNTLIGTIVILSNDAEVFSQQLLLGEHLADGSSIATEHSQLPPAGYFDPTNPEIAEYYSKFNWGDAEAVTRIELRVAPEFTGTLIVRGISLIDDRSGAFMPTSISIDNNLHLIHSGDVKIYEYREAYARAWLECAPEIVPDQESAWSRMAEQPAKGIVVLSEEMEPVVDHTCDPQTNSTANITTYEPELIEISIDVVGTGNYLFLADAWYPGWSATIDGKAAEVLQANGMFRAIAVPPGQHEIVFNYQNRMLKIGGIISGLALVGTLIALVVLREDARPSR